jgi:hypothetical protein
MFIKSFLFIFLSILMMQAKAESNKYYSYEVKMILMDNKTHSKTNHIDIFCSQLTKEELINVKGSGNAERFSKHGSIMNDKLSNSTITVYMTESPKDQESCKF